MNNLTFSFGTGDFAHSIALVIGLENAVQSYILGHIVILISDLMFLYLSLAFADASMSFACTITPTHMFYHWEKYR